MGKDHSGEGDNGSTKSGVDGDDNGTDNTGGN